VSPGATYDAPVTLLFQDARRPLLGAIIDDGSLLSPDPPDVASAVDRFRTLRESSDGWMIGNLAVPAPALEDLAGILIRTMRPGEAPWRITVAFEADDPGVVSAAAAFHAAMDPAVSVEAAFLPLPDAATVEAVERAIGAARGIQPDALPLPVVDPARDPARSIRTIVLARERMLQPAGVVIAAAPGVPAEALAEAIVACIVDDVPFVVAGGALPPVTSTDGRIGVLNMLAVATGGAGRSVADAAALLVDGGAFTVGFGGLDTPAGRTPTRPLRPPTRGPLLAIVAPDPGEALRSLAAHTSSR